MLIRGHAAVPTTIVEIGITVRDLGAEQPIDGETRHVLGGGKVAGATALDGDERAELAGEPANVGVAGVGGVLYVEMIDEKTSIHGVSACASQKQQPKRVANAEVGAVTVHVRY